MNSRTINAFALALLCLPGAAMGQDDRGASVGGSVSATNMDSRTELSFSAAFGYRFSRVVGLELETTVVPTLKSAFSGVPTQGLYALAAGGIAVPGGLSTTFLELPTVAFTNPNGRAVIFSNNVRIAIPTTTPRLEPFFVAGGGIASIRHSTDLVISYPRFLPPVPGIASIPTPPPFTYHETSSSLGLALTLGGGVSIRVASQMFVDADLRLFRVLGDQDQNVGRFGVGVRYRF